MPKKLIAWAAVTVALALVALPDAVGSVYATDYRQLPPDALQTDLTASADGASITVGGLDPAYQSASFLGDDTSIVDTAGAPLRANARTKVLGLNQKPSWDWKPARFTLYGEATWYDNGTTAMKLPYGTLVVICGKGGCVERKVTDYGPGIPRRIVDLMPGDFVKTCGCATWVGIQMVTVRVY